MTDESVGKTLSATSLYKSVSPSCSGVATKSPSSRDDPFGTLDGEQEGPVERDAPRLPPERDMPEMVESDSAAYAFQPKKRVKSM